MRRLLRGLSVAILFFGGLLASTPAQAVSSEIPPQMYYPPVYISAFSTNFTSVGGSLDVIELHSDSGQPMNMDGWSVVAFDTANKQMCTINLNSWITPDNYVVAANDEFTVADTTKNVRSFGECQQPARSVTYLKLLKDDAVQETIGAIPAPGFYARKGDTKTYRSGQFTTDFVANKRSTVYAGAWYDPLANTPFQVSEILPRARECSPLSRAGDCNDYVKLYNPTTEKLDINGLRLRIGYKGQVASSSNAIVLSGSITGGSYGLIAAEADGSPLSITNDGGYVWLEDEYGANEPYKHTVVAYPSATSTTKIGQSWALIDGNWQWALPRPNSANQPLPPLEESSTSSTPSSVPCNNNQFRNPDTGRCKLLESTTTSLQACASNQYRSSTTNRCRLISSANSMSSLKACASNQYRSPQTNRCRLIAASTNSLKPCAANQARSPETNRCRKVASTTIPKAGYGLEETPSGSSSSIGWLAFVGVGSLAIGYGIWEWRREIAGLFSAFAAKIKG